MSGKQHVPASLPPGERTVTLLLKDVWVPGAGLEYVFVCVCVCVCVCVYIYIYIYIKVKVPRDRPRWPKGFRVG